MPPTLQKFHVLCKGQKKPFDISAHCIIEPTIENTVYEFKVNENTVARFEASAVLGKQAGLPNFWKLLQRPGAIY
ncbi:MAG: hypothetical protein OXN23_06310 [Gammaproteobacteria bacterium]|nr:hypothetical protein [Gammaproteobacteria bacterium]MDE0303023.1 hypothetical protein [Gammaproteobacteria bacterium]